MRITFSAALAALLFGVAAPAAAAPVLSGASASLSAASCVGTSWCMAVGSYTAAGREHALAQIWNGTSWRVLKPPGGSLGGVSCTRPSFCMASGGPTGAERWNGRSWRTMTGPSGAATSPSCGSRSLCMVINGGSRNGSGPVAESWNGIRWRTWWDATSVCLGPPGFPCGLSDVACGSAVNCVAVGTETISQEPTQISVGAFWNGRSWAFTYPPGAGNPAAMTQVSCAGGFCMAVGGSFAEVDSGDIAVAGSWNATTRTWQDVSPNLGVICKLGLNTCGWTVVISCGSSTNCMTFGRFGNLAWNGTGWIKAPSVSAGRGSSLSAVGCSGPDCMAVGYRTISGHRHTLAEIWNGRSWRILSTPNVG